MNDNLTQLLAKVCKKYTSDKLILVKCLIANGADVNYKCGGYDKKSVLFRVCEEYTPDKLDLVKCLITNGADVNYECEGYFKESILFRVCEEYTPDKFELVQCLITNGADVNYKCEGYFKESILNTVCKHYTPDKFDLVQCLIENGAIVYSEDMFKNVILNFSIQKKKLLELLIDKDYGTVLSYYDMIKKCWKNPNVRHSFLGALQVIFSKRPGLSFVPFLITEIIKQTQDENLAIASWQKLVIKRLHSMSHIFQYEHDIAFKYIFSNVNLTRFLFSIIDISTLSHHHSKNFYEAIRLSFNYISRDVILFFVDIGVDLNIKNEKGNTLLHVAANRFDAELLDVLCYHINDINAINTYNETAWDRVNTFLTDSYDSDIEDEEEFYEKYITPDLKKFADYSRVFMKHGADPFMAYTNKDEGDKNLMMSNLARVYIREMSDIVEYCYKNVDINRVLYDGNTIAHEAARRDNPHLLEYLLHVGARTDLKNKCGDIPLHIATSLDFHECIKLLLNARDICVPNDDDGAIFCDFVCPHLVRDVMSTAYCSDPSLLVLSQCVAACPYTERKRIRNILMILNRTPIPKTLFAHIVAHSFDENNFDEIN
ncbi:ankyrin repeat protein [Paramecium bursaria Chlorella virus CVR-1]|uniref:Ankyrin repeat protein n=1 Tax=Paramecium bursaria Chlorella virus CVA-1 TaxID=42683 RepID=M1HL11_9PHYC|nr:ankyrin repeat protein [Paramecium bursaria Chlorella virus CVA-1]AGE50371.1 ankyrin repeat protein [Paramecium bursaria Chlorella virus CVA-1]AGE52047.1 ankyrin repeat protein [Paramecium bursaria Chlorella virus CVR-1]